MNILDLPEDITRQFFRFLDERSSLFLRITCSRFLREFYFYRTKVRDAIIVYLNSIDMIQGLIGYAKNLPLNMMLLYNCRIGDLKMVKFLTSLGAELDFNDEHPLSLAVRRGYLKIVKYIMTRRVPRDPENIFSCAAKYGHLSIIKYFLTLDSFRHINPERAMALAAGNYHFDIVKLLIKTPFIRNGQPYMTDITIDNNRLTKMAVFTGKVKLTEFLLEFSEIRAAIDKNELLVLAATKGDIEMVKLLLTAGANPIADNNLAVRCAAIYNRLDVIKILLTIKGVDPSANNNEALIYAIRHNYVDMVQFLCRLPSVMVGMDRGTFLMEAMSSRNDEIIKFFLEIFDIKNI